MSESSGEIIVRGGSAEIQFDPTLFERNEKRDPQSYKQRKELRITQVIIEGDQHIDNYTSKEHPAAFKGTVRVKFKYPK